MISGGVLRAPRAVRRRCGALLFAIGLMAVSCRHEGTGPDRPAAPVDVRLPAGVRYVFDSWQLDRFGQRIQGSFAPRFWFIAATNASFFGFTDVVVVLDSSAVAAGDTLYFRTPVAGNIEQFGFLADVIRHREAREIPPRWDRLTNFSAGITGEWPMGAVDSAGRNLATARSTGDQVLFELQVRGVRMAVPAQRITYTAGNVEGSYWVASEGFLRFRNERFLVPVEVNGELLELVAIEDP